MSNFIDVNAYIKYCDEHWIPLNVDAVKAQPIVEVVRCKDCKWLDIYTINGEDITACNNENAFFRDVRCDEHCSCGERREDDGF